jgi:hypothetical protein
MSGNNAPLDIRPVWFNLIRRLQSAASLNHGVAVISVNIVIKDTVPEFWTSPRVTLIEPMAKKEYLLKLLSGEDI